MKTQPQQSLGPQARRPGLGNIATAPQEAVGDAGMIGGVEDVVAVDNPSGMPEGTHTVSWLHAGIRNQSKDPPKESLPQKFESKPLESGRVDIYDDGLSHLTAN